jgi:transcriptional regulator of acetoin/glycerol metabolism
VGPPEDSEEDAGLGDRAELEKAHLLAALHEHGWNRAQAAKALGINRATVWRKLKIFNISDPG